MMLTFEKEVNFLKKFLLLSLFNVKRKQEKKSLSKKYCPKVLKLDLSMLSISIFNNCFINM